MATKRQQKEQQNGNKAGDWQPPRGIRYGKTRAGGMKRFQLHWRDDNGNRQSEGFASARERELAARALADKRDRHGASILTFDPAQWRRWLEFHAVIGEGVDPLVVAHEWRELRQGMGASGAGGLTVAEAFKRYFELRESERLSEDTRRHIAKHVGERFAGAFGALRLTALTADHIRGWMGKLTNPKTGEPMEDLTKRHHRKDVNTFLDRARKEGWITRNPCELVTPPVLEEGDVSVMPVRDVFEFFKANVEARCVGRVALEAFGGLRYSTAARIERRHLNFAERGIEMPGAIHKSGKRKYRQGHPDVLWAWLEHAPEACWGLSKRQYAEDKRLALVQAGLRELTASNAAETARIEALRNVWRHSFASYMIAHTKNVPRVGYLMQHTHTATTEIYEGVATEADARLYLAITPEAVRKWTWREFSVSASNAKA